MRWIGSGSRSRSRPGELGRWEVVLALVVAACSRGEPVPAPEVAVAGEAPVAPEPIDLRSLELDSRPAEGAAAGAWVRCAGGVLRDGARVFEACRDESLTWVDTERDKVTIEAYAANARVMVIEGKVARFVDLRARVEVDLRRLMAKLPAGRIDADTRLAIDVLIEGEGESTLRGTLELETPRVLQLMPDVGDQDEGDQDDESDDGTAPEGRP